MLEWNKLSDKKPAHNQMCFITNGSEVAGPFPWKQEAEGFLDFFHTPEAGAMYGESEVSHWCDEAEMNLPGAKC